MVFAQDETEALETLGRLTLQDWLIAGGIFVGSIIVARVASRLLQRLLNRTPASDHGAQLISRFVAYVLIVVGFVYALNSVNVPIGPLLGALGVAGLALAFAFQDILENLIAGVGMQIRRPMRPGDEIVTNGYEGTVLDITLRTVIITTFDGERVYLPNSMVWKAPILNATERDTRRTTLMVGVAYGTNLDRAKEILEAAVRGVDGVLEHPPPTAHVMEFAESSIDFALRYWHRPSMSVLWRTRDEVARQVKRSLDEATIEIPFPQRVVHLPVPETDR